MNVEVSRVANVAGDTQSRLAIADCDLHLGPRSLDDLRPFLSTRVQSYIDTYGMAHRVGWQNGEPAYPKSAPYAARRDAHPPNGSPPGTDLDFTRRQHLDAFNVQLGLVNPPLPSQNFMNPDLGNAMCRALNEWQIEALVRPEPRLRASIVVPAQAPLLAAEEIERRAGDKRFVQILMPAACEMMLGRSYYWPIYEAAAKYDLPIGLHAGSMYRYAPTSGGWPSHYLHDYVANSQLFEDQLLSLISNGVFNRWPDLRFVLIESGVSWLPGFIWRAIKTWRGVRAEVPWVKRSPAETIRENIRLTVQPFDAPRDNDVVERLIEQIDSDRMLLFASDYPHWQFEGDAVLPPGLSPALLQRIRVENPLETYPRLKETIA